MIGVAGLGLVGGSLLQGLAAVGVEVAGYDVDPGGARRAGFPVTGGVEELARECDVVVVCVPPRATAETVQAALAADPDVVVADACSVKGPIVAALSDERFVPAHPLAGAAEAGWEAAEPALLREAVWAVCPPASAEALCAFSAAVEPLGTRLVACTAEEHDTTVARTSHVPHLVAQALAALPADPLAAALSGGALRDMTRTAMAGEALWLDILMANREPARAALDDLRAGFDRLAHALDAGDEEALRAAWRDGTARRQRVEALRWGEPTWHARTVAGWAELIELGRAGVAVRRLRMAGPEIALEATAA